MGLHLEQQTLLQVAGPHPGRFETLHQAQNLLWVCKHARELAGKHGLEFVPTRFRDIAAEARQAGAY